MIHVQQVHTTEGAIWMVTVTTGTHTFVGYGETEADAKADALRHITTHLPPEPSAPLRQLMTELAQ